MKSITIHNLDSATVQKIEEIARQTGRSLNSVIKETLARALGTDKAWVIDERERVITKLSGSWTEEELKEFENAVADCRHIDLDEW